MMITDKCKEDFIKWLNQQEVAPYAVMFDELPKNVKCMYIVEWLDSIEMYFWVYRSEIGYWATSIERKAKYNDRNEALMNGIEIINLIYNDGK